MKNVISRRSFLKAAGIIGASAALAACGGSSASTAGSTAGAAASGESVTFTLSMVDNEQSNYYKGAQAIADSVNEATNGQFQIKVVAGGTLDQAFLWDSQDQANYAVRNELGDLIQEKANAQGIHVIGYMESGFRDVFSKKPIQTMADFNGVKIRTMQNDGQLLAFTSFGANPVALAAGDQFTARTLFPTAGSTSSMRLVSPLSPRPITASFTSPCA